MSRRSKASLVAVVVVLLALPSASYAAGEGWGPGNSSDQVDTESEFEDTGEAYSRVQQSAEELYDGGTPGTFAFPINQTIYGKPVVVFPDPADGFAMDDWEEYCFRVAYSVSPVDEVEERQVGANGSFELMQDRDYWEPAFLDYQEALRAYRDYWAREAENEERIADGLEPLPRLPWPGAEPVEPTFPLPLCEGAPGEAPDFRPAFEAAAELLESIDEPRLQIAPGTGITGLEGYLETGRTMDVNEERRPLTLVGWDYSADPLNPVAIPGSGVFTGYGRYSVDWGDGVITGPHRSGGIAHGDTPDGEQVAVTHAYEDAGTYDVVVTDEWWVEMRIEFLGETYTFIHHEVLDAWDAYVFPVDEVRSVRQR